MNEGKQYHRCNRCRRMFRGKMQSLCYYCNGKKLREKALKELKHEENKDE